MHDFDAEVCRVVTLHAGGNGLLKQHEYIRRSSPAVLHDFDDNGNNAGALD